MKSHPAQSMMFETYVKTHRGENEFLKFADACGIFLLQKKTSA
jgi:hypothetical protein